MNLTSIIILTILEVGVGFLIGSRFLDAIAPRDGALMGLEQMQRDSSSLETFITVISHWLPSIVLLGTSVALIVYLSWWWLLPFSLAHTAGSIWWHWWIEHYH